MAAGTTDMFRATAGLAVRSRLTTSSRAATPLSCWAGEAHRSCQRSSAGRELPLIHASASRKPASLASASISFGVKKLMKGVPFARAPSAARSIAGRTSASASSNGSMKDMASVEPGASAATWRSVPAIASLVRVHANPGGSYDRRPVCIEASFRETLPPRFV